MVYALGGWGSRDKCWQSFPPCPVSGQQQTGKGKLAPNPYSEDSLCSPPYWDTTPQRRGIAAIWDRISLHSEEVLVEMHLSPVAFSPEPLNHNNVTFGFKAFQRKTAICLLEPHALTCPRCTSTHLCSHFSRGHKDSPGLGAMHPVHHSKVSSPILIVPSAWCHF